MSNIIEATPWGFLTLSCLVLGAVGVSMLEGENPNNGAGLFIIGAAGAFLSSAKTLDVLQGR